MPELAEDGQLVSIGGMKWHPQQDTLEVQLPKLHFSKKLRGRLLAGTQVFEGSMMEQLDSFVPKKLSRRIIFSKNAAIFDLPGKLAPILGILKVDLREAVEQTEGWDDPVPEELRLKWIKNEKGNQEILKFYKPGFIKNISIEKAGVVRKFTVQYQNSSENLPQFTDRARSLLKLFIINNVGWQQEIDLVDKLIEEVDDVKKDVVQKFAKNFMSGLQYRLKAVSDYYEALHT